MIVQKKQNINGAFIPDLPENFEYKTAVYRPATDDYLVTFTPEQEAAQRITAAQGRVQLIREGKKAQVDSFIANSQNEKLKTYWEYSTYWLRHSNVIKQLGAQFEIDLDDFWAKAKAVNL